MRDSSARGLVDHWLQASRQGSMKASTAQAFALTCRRILEVQESWESLNVESLDVDDALTRFKSLTTRNLRPRTISDYEARFRRAVASYRDYLVNPNSWKYPSRSLRSSGPIRPPQSRDSDGSSQPHKHAHAFSATTPSASIQEYPYPIRTDVLAKLAIPRDATSAEINRLVAWARTLAIDYEPPT